MRALLLSAGFGTRLRPLTDTIPKCLVPIAGRPLLDYWLELLIKNGVEKVLINTHYLAEQVRSYASTSTWSNHIELVHESALYGTGGTILRNAEFFKSKTFFVAHADNLVSFDFKNFLNSHQSRPEPQNIPISMMTFNTDRPESCGIVETDNRGVVIAFHEKQDNPPGNRANGAVYIFEPETLTFLRSLEKEIIDLSTEVIPEFIGRIATYHNHIYLRDIGTPQSLKQAEDDIRTGVFPTGD